VASSKVYNSQYADELVFLNIARSNRSVDTLLNLIERVSEVSFMPLTFGGGIRSLRDAEKLILHGADKVIVNSATYENPRLITAIADKFGSQAVIASIDAFKTESGYQLVSNCGQSPEATVLEEHIETLVKYGAGEILINSVDRDGSMKGYDIDLIKIVMAHSSLPVIACGGAGTYEHMKEAFIQTGVSALACGSLFNFGDNNPIRAKAFLSNYDLNFKKV